MGEDYEQPGLLSCLLLKRLTLPSLVDRFSAGAAEVALRAAATAKTRVARRAIAGIWRESSVLEGRKKAVGPVVGWQTKWEWVRSE